MKKVLVAMILTNPDCWDSIKSVFMLRPESGVEFDYLFIRRGRGKNKAEKMESMTRNRNAIREYAILTDPDYVFFVDDDQIIPEDAFSILYARVGEADIIAGVTSPRHDPSGWTTAYQFLKEEKGGAEFGKIVEQIVPSELGDVTQRFVQFNPNLPYVDAVGLFCTLVKMRVLAQISFECRMTELNIWVGGEEPKYYTCGADDWFCLQAKKAEFRIIQVPECKVFHKPTEDNYDQ